MTDSETVAGARSRARARDRGPGHLGATRTTSACRDRVSLATPDGERASRSSASSVPERIRVRRRGLRGDAARRSAEGDGQEALVRRDRCDRSRAARRRSPRSSAASSRRFGKGVEVETPQTKSEDVESQLQAFNAILYFFAAMALFVGGFLIFNAFNMTVLQRTREIGMLRTLGTPRRRITGSVLREAALLGFVGAVLGLGLGFALAWALAELVRALDFPVGRLVFTWWAPVAAVATGLLTAVLGAFMPARRAGRTSPIRAVLGSDELRPKPSVRRGVRRRRAHRARARRRVLAGRGRGDDARGRGRRHDRHGRDLLRDRDGGAVRGPPARTVLSWPVRKILPGRGPPRLRRRALGSRPDRRDRDRAPHRPGAGRRRQQPRRELPGHDLGRVRPRLRARPDRPAVGPLARPGAAADDRRPPLRCGSRRSPRRRSSRASASSSPPICPGRRARRSRTASSSASSRPSTPRSTRPTSRARRGTRSSSG